MAVLLFLAAAALYDWKYREIPRWVYLAGGLEAFFWRMAVILHMDVWLGSESWMVFFHGNNKEVSFLEAALGAMVGIVLLLLSRAADGSIGAGDGMLFLITGIYFGFWKNIALFLGSLLLCSIWGIGYLFIKKIGWQEGRKLELPFLIFVLPIGMWLNMI